MSITLRDPLPVFFARGVAAVGLGTLAGFTLTVSRSSIANIFAVKTLTPRDRLHLWREGYESGASFAKVLVPTTTTLLAVAAFFAKSAPNEAPLAWIAKHRTFTLGSTAVATASIFAYTLAVMMPNIKQMKNIEAKLISEGVDAEGSAAQTDPMIRKWLSQHHVRTAIAMSAFLVSIVELLLG